MRRNPPHPSAVPVPIPRPRDGGREHRAVLAELGSTDPVTGLPGRLRTAGLLEAAARDARTSGAVLGLLTVELSGVDAIAERFGRAAADDVLRSAALRVRGCLRRGDLVGRLGPARIAVALHQPAPAAASAEIAGIGGALADAVGAPYVVAGEQVSLRVRIGSAPCPADADDVAGLLGTAAAAAGGVLR